MKRTPLLYTILIIELAVGIILLYNFRYLSDLLKQKAMATTTTIAAATSVAPAANPPAQQAAAPQPANNNPQPANNNPPPLKLVELSPAVLSVLGVLPTEATPTDYKITEEMITLGRMLFYEPRLSATQDMSCNTCHVLGRYGVDGLALSLSGSGKLVKRNTPTVYNAAFHMAQFWDGRSPTVEDQARLPIVSMGEMEMETADRVEKTLRSIPGYVQLFNAAFPNQPNPVTYQNLGIAIGAFERRLVTPSRFDKFFAGDRSQLNANEQRGLATFITFGCPTCHSGMTIGGQLYKKLGEKETFPTDDLGRFNVTKLEEDRYVFKVPSLRNVAKTAPYMHDGKIQTLEEMVKIMARYQLGKQVTDAQVADIVTFLNALTGELPSRPYIAQPVLPPNGPDTPGPQRVN
ncbi:MAG: cytochrome c peroxidase [Caldilineaceae bacterium]